MSCKVLFQVQASRTLVYKDSSKLLSSVEQGVSHVLRTPMWAGIFLSSSDKNLLLHEGFSLVFDLSALQACQCLWLGSHLAKGNSPTLHFFLRILMLSKGCPRGYWWGVWPNVNSNICAALYTSTMNSWAFIYLIPMIVWRYSLLAFLFSFEEWEHQGTLKLCHLNKVTE